MATMPQEKRQRFLSRMLRCLWRRQDTEHLLLNSAMQQVSVYRSADFQSAVAPICNRPSVGHSQGSGFCGRSAGYKPAIQQTASLRYERRQRGKQILQQSSTLRYEAPKTYRRPAVSVAFFSHLVRGPFGRRAAHRSTRAACAPPPLDKLGVLLGTGCLLCILGCSRTDKTSPGPEKSSSAQAEHVADATSAFAASLPHVGGPAGYVGSKSCRNCHEDQFESWHRSYHRTMTQIAAPDTVQADFHDVTLTNDGVRIALSRKGDQFWVHLERPASAGAGEVSPESLDVRAGLVTGSHHMQVFWLPGGEGNTQIGFPFTWLIPEKRWVDRESKC